ncbi:MAG: chromosome segregation protein SMC [Clostridiaceae bacterium]
MFLKSIEIKGFKSFADKTEILFKEGITSIVGPNGSGKSNISDAVRWVLGEQSIKTLRGGKMEDVIFAGTQFRKPVGLSQVSLVLDNNDLILPLDYSDVTISRRLYRSGESDYFINNTRCRLKDIQELFMDTGIGREGYSIIGQGKIEAILSGKQDDKRGLLEEAAGIVKFRSRKEEAEKKLNNTNQNLIRINDILDTYIDRLEPLEEDSKKAEIFIQLSEKLKAHEINLLVTSIDNCDKNINNISAKLELLNQELTRLKDSDNSSSNKKNSLYDELEKSESSQEEKNKEIYNLKAWCQKLESEKDVLAERQSSLNTQIEKNAIELESISLKLDNALKSKYDFSVEFDSKTSERDMMDDEIEKIEKLISDAESEISAKSIAYKALREKNIEMLQKISDTKNSISLLENSIIGQKSKIENMNLSNIKLAGSIASGMEAKTGFETDKEKNILEIENLERQISLNKESKNRLNNLILENENKLKKHNINQNKMEANKVMLINMEKKHEGYNKTVKVLMQDMEDLKVPVDKNSCFLIGDIIEVTRDCELAIDIALGSSISDVITKDAETAKMLINYLKTNSIGRATFLPLSIIKPKKANSLESLSRIKGYIGIASNLIKYDPGFENAISFLLGRTLICTDMDTALEIAAKTAYSYKIVTLTGEVVNPSGSLTGGSTYHKSTSVIGRKREIEELSLRLDENVESIKQLSIEQENYRQENKILNENNSKLNEDILNRKIEITKFTEKINALNENIARFKERLSMSNYEIESINTEISADLLKLEELKGKLIDISNINDTDNEEIVSIETDLKSENDFIKTQNEKMLEYRIKRAKADEAVSNISTNISRITEEIDDYTSRKTAIAIENETSEKAISECRKKFEESNAILLEKSASINSLQSVMEDLNITRIKLKNEIKSISEDAEALFSEISIKETEVHRLDILKGKHETEKEIHLGKLNDEMGLTYAEALSFKSDIKNMGEYKEYISNIKNEISRLGVVNLGAIEEYKDVKGKITFMTMQKNDLNSSKEELEKLIGEMINKMKLVFREHFTTIRKLFNETFCELFSGGKADLLLADGDELDGNIEIEVQPPGKKLQNINLLSGGEKGLSAIALLFAILKMKPTPFCILDEIEASLDDANVKRYADFLKRFSKGTQFIVITHRKGTMEVSDALYGITMEEKGVSKVVSVDFGK